MEVRTEIAIDERPCGQSTVIVVTTIDGLSPFEHYAISREIEREMKRFLLSMLPAEAWR